MSGVEVMGVGVEAVVKVEAESEVGGRGYIFGRQEL
jgi:hypothetical protein